MQLNAAVFEPAATTRSAVVPLRRREDAALAELIAGYGAHGGLASTDELVGLMRPHWRQPISILAKWIVGRKVVSFMSRTQFVLPVFQFARPQMTPNEAVGDCSIALADLLGVEAFAAWFVRPCEWLGRRMPVDLLANDPGAVVDAAGRTRLALMACRLSD
ncbi:hypothetical protein [Scleromatobacter humisilvae]|uniref:Antitoxin Xre/MbcA/ParS-like toxin-binding domain-containing protein n=1 Tax=Scleromatobacter humisilvae TaxID=2897159 RepID=A0A9X1YRC9_9BURK|nr:hypothetical protein [Scleromatobacter humisilvae]MCK9687111.1 hypothetical protein [Scleromatobacter humisilvae]